MEGILIRLYGSLAKVTAASRGERHRLRIYTGGPRSLVDLLADVGIPMEKIQLIMVNHRAVPKGSVVLPGDRVAVFPTEYALFADWKDLRSPRGIGEPGG